jgi:peptidoglycan/LPS O-acetylase OafA/YrhL
MTPEATSPTSLPAAERFHALDGLRGVAAIAVIIDHLPRDIVHDVLPGRALSVDFFFMLSGFVLAHAYGARLGNSLSPFAFMKLRLIRLYPLYILGTVIALPLAFYGTLNGWSGGPDLVVAAGLGVLFLPTPPLHNDLQAALYPLNGPAWSLLFELIANFVYAILARFLSLRLLACLLPISAAALAFTTFRHVGISGPGWLWAHFDSGLARVLFGFFAGVFLYRLREVWRAPALPVWLSFAVFLAIIGAPAGGMWRPALDAVAVIVLFPFLVMLSANAKAGTATVRVCSGLGLMSYSIYMLHVPLLGVVTLVADKLAVRPPDIVFVILFIAFAAGAATLANRYYDGPARHWLSAWLAPRKTALSAVESPGRDGRREG